MAPAPSDASRATVAVSGIGGIFFRAEDPAALARWYDEHFGIMPAADHTPWDQEGGPTVVAPFDRDTDYFGPKGQGHMLNLRVRDLDAAVQGLEAKGIKQVKPSEDMPGVGRFAWVEDPEGNRIELWEPAP